MINIKKCHFCRLNVELLGYSLFTGGYQLGEKALKKWLQISVPTTLNELQQLMGKFQFASTFLIDYKKQIKPIEALLSKQNDCKWTKSCTAAVNSLVQQIFQRLRLQFADPEVPVQLHCEFGGELAQLVGVQNNLPVLLACKRLNLTEQKLSLVEKYVVAFAWALNKYPGVFLELEKVQLMLPHQELVVLVQSRDVCEKIKAKLINLQLQNCEWKLCKRGQNWQLLDFLQHQELIPGKPEYEVPVLEHQADVKIKYPHTKAIGEDINLDGCIVGYFDGGYAKKVATCGYVAYDPGGDLMLGAGVIVPEAKTNNQAELTALEMLVKEICTGPLVTCKRVVCIGDS